MRVKKGAQNHNVNSLERRQTSKGIELWPKYVSMVNRRVYFWVHRTKAGKHFYTSLPPVPPEGWIPVFLTCFFNNSIIN